MGTCQILVFLCSAQQLSFTLYKADKYEELTQLWKSALSEVPLMSFEIPPCSSYVGVCLWRVAF